MRNKFLNYLFLFIITTAAITFNVNADSGYLYDVLKNETESGGLAREYTGEHHDSFTEEPSKKIYHWYAENDTEGNQVLEKNNVIFANHCWQMIRTTDTGGVKIIYNGVPNEGKCNNTGTKQQVSTSFFNLTNSLAYVGYMYNPNTLITYKANVAATSGSVFGNGVIYSEGNYTLTNTSTTYDANHHYTCNNTTGICDTVRYYYYKNWYVELNDGRNIEQTLEDMLSSDTVNQKDSIIKEFIDNWYQNNMVKYTLFLEDTIYCNDRSISNLGGWNPNGGRKDGYLQFNNNYLNEELKCINETDKFSIYNSKAKLTYPIGLMTSSEMNLLGNNYLLKTDNSYWLISPSNGPSVGAITSVRKISIDGSIGTDRTSLSFGIRPTVSLTQGTIYISGTGTKNNPYVVRNLTNSNIIINNDNTKGTISNLDNTTNVEELSNVSFNITPEEGYLVREISVKDSNNEDVEYTKSGNSYSFVMPDSDTTITPVYDKVKNSVNVEIINETNNLEVEINDMTQVEYEEEVRFKITPIKGYKVNSIKILDEDNNEIEHQETNIKNEYTFIMPASNVTIIPSYERVSNSVNVDDNKNTKEIVINVNDARAVVYEDTVKFIIVPEDEYEIERIEIIDKEGNKIEYRKADKDNEYEFTMPDTDVVITPVYRKKEVHNNITNPKTSNRILIIISLLFLIVYIITMFFRKKERV